MSSDCMDLVTKSLSLPTRLGGGKGRPELPHSIGRAVPRFFRSGNETWLVWILNEPVVERQALGG